jgi:lipopolysaccharide biosynthesis protein
LVRVEENFVYLRGDVIENFVFGQFWKKANKYKNKIR